MPRDVNDPQCSAVPPLPEGRVVLPGAPLGSALALFTHALARPAADEHCSTFQTPPVLRIAVHTRALEIRLGARTRPRHFALITAHSVTVTPSHTIIAIATERAPTRVQYIGPRKIFILVPTSRLAAPLQSERTSYSAKFHRYGAHAPEIVAPRSRRAMRKAAHRLRWADQRDGHRFSP